jgi:uncharacterized protein
VSQSVVPFQQFVLKVHSRCDLACDHCYIYFGHDQGWHDRPVVMTMETAALVAQRIAEHAKTHGLQQVHVVLHGGEPLLAGVDRLRGITEVLRAQLDGVSALDLRIHTNGVRLDDAFCQMFAETGIRVGISLDGYRAANDLHRRYANGRSSFDQVIRAVSLLSGRYRNLYLGLLCTIDLRNDPVAVHEALVALDPPRIDYLLPHATWDEPPPRHGNGPTAYADWLIAIFDRWTRDGKPVDVRLFDSVISTSNGGDSLTEAIGLQPSNLVVIETDGSYEQADSLKASFEGAQATDSSVFRDCLDVVASHPGIKARQSGLKGLCQTCRSCSVVSSCGGGLYAHRYQSSNGFANPSVYCADLMKLIKHIRQDVKTAEATVSPDLHALPRADFDSLAAGYGGSTAVGQLRETQYSLIRGVLAALVGRALGSAGAASVASFGLGDSWDLLSRVDQLRPDAAQAVLSHPYIRVWALSCLERIPGCLERTPADSGAESLTADLGYLGAVAIAAAIRAGLEGSAEVPVRAGTIGLPTLGRLEIGELELELEIAVATIETSVDKVCVRAGQHQWEAERVSGSDGSVDLVFSAATETRWLPVRTLTAPGISVTFEDTDVYRDCHGWPAAPRASQEEFAGWSENFAAAWDLILADFSDYAPGLAAGLKAVMPLAPSSADSDISSTARNAFGAVAVAPAADPATLALLLIHEFQHVKLGAILDLFELYDKDDIRLFRAPWRKDKRPLEGLLQGTYAHVAVADFWRIRQQIGGQTGDAAASRYVHWREQTASAIEELADCGSLTPLGIRLNDAMRETVSSWPSSLADRP